MAVLNIQGRKVTVDDSFLKLSTEQQNSTVEEIASSFAPNKGAEDVARSDLAKGLREGRNSDQQIYQTAAFRSNQGVRPANATDAAINSATAGFADEVSAAARAPIDMIARGESFNEAYQHNLAAERDRLAQYQNQNPITAGAASVAGGLAFPAGKAAPIRSAATVGAIFGAGNSEGDLAQRATDATLGGVGGAALGSAVSGIARAVGPKAPSSAPSINQLKAEAARGYNSEVVKGLEIAPKAVADAATAIRLRLDDAGFDEIIGTKAHGILKRVQAMPDGASSVTGNNLRSIQKTLGKAVGSTDPQERAAASMALSEFNQFLEAVPAAQVLRGSADDFSRVVKEANANWAAARASEGIDKKLVAAEIRAGAANSGMNVANTIRQRMADVAINPKAHRGLSQEERATAQRIAEGTKGQNALRWVGNTIGGGGGMGTLTSGGIGVLAAGGASGLALPATGVLMRAIGNRMTINQAEKLSEAIRSRAPLASATQKFEEKVAQFQQARNAKSASAAALAARNLATNMRGAGFNVSASDLMRGIQGGVTARAEDE